MSEKKRDFSLSMYIYLFKNACVYLYGTDKISEGNAVNISITKAIGILRRDAKYKIWSIEVADQCSQQFRWQQSSEIFHIPQQYTSS